VSDLFRSDFPSPGFWLDGFCTDVTEYFQHETHIAEVRDIAQHDGLFGQQGGSENRKGGILRTTDLDLAVERAVATNFKDIHELFCSTKFNCVSHPLADALASFGRS
jgi:hypothetical protein